MRDHCDDSQTRDDAESEVSEGEAPRPQDGFRQDAKHPQAGHVGQQMPSAAVEKHVGKQREPRRQNVPAPQQR